MIDQNYKNITNSQIKKFKQQISTMHLHSSYTSFKTLASINGYKQQLPARSHSLFEKAITIFRPSAKVLMQANNLFNVYCQQNKSQVEQQVLSLLSEISVFVAQSSQELRDLRGKKISGIGLSLNRLLGNSKSIKQTIEELTKFIKNTPIYIQQQYKREMEQYLIKTQLTCKIMHNFEYYIKQLQFTNVQSVQNTKYKDTFIELAWMLYIDCRDNFIRNLQKYPPFQSNVCLLASTLYFMIRYSMDYIYPRALKNDRQSDKRALIAKILQLLLDLFNIQNIELYKKIAEKFDQYIEIQIHTQTLRIVASDTDFFSPSIIHLNYKQLQNRYQKNLQPKDVDYRLFRKQKSLTPIHKEVLVNNRLRKNLTQPKNTTRVFKSHRYLNYEQTQGDKQEVLSRQNSKSSNNPENPPKNRILNKFNINCVNKELLINGEGINTQIYRYIKSITSNRRQQRQSKKSQATVKIIQNYLQKYKLPFQYSPVIKKYSSEISQSVYQVYLYFCQKVQYSLERSSPYSNNDSISSQINYNLIAICLVIVLSMYSQMANSNQQAIQLQIPIFNIVAYVCNPSPLQLWFLIQVIIQKQPNLPGLIRKILIKEQRQILCKRIWQDSIYIDQIAELAANYDKSYQILYFSEKLFEYCERFLQKMMNQLQFSAQHSIYAYNCMKFILSANGEILQNRHLDQILMCTLYISGKTLASPILFIHIKQAYQKLSNNLSQSIYSNEPYFSGEHFKSEQIFNNVVQDQNGSGDIIYFYNKYFIQNVKPFVPYMANPSLCLLHPLFQRKITQNSQQLPEFESPQQNKQQHMLSLMQTQKPKAPPTRYNNNAKKTGIQKPNDRIGILIKSQRNETRVRIRPNNNYIQNELCETQKIKSSDAKQQRDDQNQYQLVSQPREQEHSHYSQNELEDVSLDLGQNY